MATPSAPELNYGLIKDDVEKLQQFYERFLRCASALATVGPLDQLLAAKQQDLAALNAQAIEKRAELDAIRETREQEGREHDARIAASNAAASDAHAQLVAAHEKELE